LRCRYLIVVPRPLPTAPKRCCSRRRKLGEYSAEKNKYYRLYLHKGKMSLALMYLRKYRVASRSLAALLAHASTAVTPPAHAAQYLGMGFRGLAGGRCLAGEEQLGRCTAEQWRHYRLYQCRDKLAHAAMYLRRVSIIDRSSAAGVSLLAHVWAIVTPPAPEAHDLSAGLRRPYRRKTCGFMLGALALIAPVKPVSWPNGSAAEFSNSPHSPL
jgi:hypothetical protein